jgi:hypothetical protein
MRRKMNRVRHRLAVMMKIWEPKSRVALVEQRAIAWRLSLRRVN